MQSSEKDRYIHVTEDLYERKQHGSPDYPLGLYHVDLQNMYLGIVRRHWHEELELTYISSGQAKYMAHDQSFPLHAGQVILINSNTMHGIYPIDGCECECEAIVFHASFLFGYEHSYLKSHYLLPLLQNPSMHALFVSDDNSTDERIPALVKEIIILNKDKPYAYELKTKELLLHIWRILLERLNANNPSLTGISPTSTQNALDEERVKTGMDYISRHYADMITLDDIADSIHISKSECCRCFKRCIQMTPFEYLLKYRIYTAVDILTNNTENLSISEIALRTGFNSSSYFNKIFKKYMNCTPSHYKKQLADGTVSPASPTHIDLITTGAGRT